MRIKQLIKILGNPRNYSGAADFEVRGISCNSKTVKDDFVFVAVKGTREDGNKFIEEAIEKGAKAVIVQSPRLSLASAWDSLRSHVAASLSLETPFGHRSGAKIPFIGVKDTRRALAELAAEFYGNPSSKIKVIGVTGTNGKTTITYLLEELIKEAGFSPAVIGTVNYRFRDKIIPSKNTTPGPIELQSMLADMLKTGIDYAVMEVSSHALHQDRTGGINFHSAIFTNLTQDHLDYHKTLDNYFRSKARLFQDIPPGSFAVINNDDKYGRRIKKLTRAGVITYGIKNKADITARDIKFDCLHTEFLLAGAELETGFRSRLIGMHNVYNVLATVAWALREGIELSAIKSAIERFSQVPGRLERIDSRAGFSVFVDYAHTEDALYNIIATLRQLYKKRIIVVFGCGGERDKTKRPKMGRVVSELSDYAIITSDNPRSEDPLQIIEDIRNGINKNNYCVIPERKEAIKKSLSLAQPGDIVLLAGKGHESYQILKDGIIHFDDREAVRECLKSMNY
jgi:UDP-N-acetylmuramoyl-L-alanyl-D-glutamate--2,6-diaminopimelate ligase